MGRRPVERSGRDVGRLVVMKPKERKGATFAIGADEARRQFEALERDRLFETEVVGAIDHPEGAFADGAIDAVLRVDDLPFPAELVVRLHALGSGPRQGPSWAGAFARASAGESTVRAEPARRARLTPR